MQLGLAIVPFTSAATDLGKAMGELSLTSTLNLFFYYPSRHWKLILFSGSKKNTTWIL